jgi:hypothetical protein
MSTTTIIESARALGGNAADAYWDEFDASPAADGPDKVGDWDSSAWSIAWKDLKDEGATDADYAACLAAWREGFWA